MRHMKDKCRVLERPTDPNTRTFPEGEARLVSFKEVRVGVGEKDRMSQAEGRTYVKSLKWQSAWQVQETDKKATTMKSKKDNWMSLDHEVLQSSVCESIFGFKCLLTPDDCIVLYEYLLWDYLEAKAIGIKTKWFLLSWNSRQSRKDP